MTTFDTAIDASTPNDDPSSSTTPDRHRQHVELLERLSSLSENVFRSDDAERLRLARELLDNFRDSKEEWANADRWPSREMELVGKKGSIRGASALQLRMAFAVGNSLRSYADHLERRLRPEKGPAELVRKVREVGDAKVYGPVSAGVLGGEFEMWTRPNNNNNNKSLENDDDGNEQRSLVAGVTVVLGAGNQSMVTVLDILHRFFNARQTVLVKHHPLRPWLYECYDVILRPLIKRGYVAQILDDGLPSITKLLNNPLCTHVHLTGCSATLQAVRKTLRQSRPDFTKEQIDAMLTSETGCASPWIVTPGKYTDKEISHVSRSLVSSKKNFGGANCVAGQVIVLPKNWDGKHEFMEAVRREFKRQPDSSSYYPGSYRRRRNILAAYPENRVEILGSDRVRSDDHESVLTDEDRVALVRCGTPGEDGYEAKALLTEAFGPVMAVVELNGGGGSEDDDDEDWLNDVAVPFVNDKRNVHGTLACNVVVPPSAVGTDSVRRAVSDLRYGMISVNEWTALAIMAAVGGGAWGAHGFPPSDNHDDDDDDDVSGSGRGFVGNPYRVPALEKMVLYRDLRLPPAFDESTQPPLLVVNQFGFELACRPDNAAGLLLNFLRVVVALLLDWTAEKTGWSFLRRVSPSSPCRPVRESDSEESSNGS